MLDQLDDPIPFIPSPELVAAAKSRGTRLRRRRRLGVTGAMIPVILVLALVAGAVYVDRRLDGVQRVDVAAGVLAPVAPGAPFNVLVVGTDGPRIDGDDGTRRSDTIMVVHVDRSGDAPPLQVLSLPRDLVFDGATSGADRINAVLPRGGPEALIATIQDHLGIDIAHYVEIDFVGFRKLIDAAGGISVQPTTSMRDDNTGLRLDASCQRLDGEEALALSRSRHLEYQDASGRWKGDPTGDLGRMTRQHTVLQLVFQKLASMPDDPSTLNTLLDIFAENTSIDAGFSRSTLLDLAVWGHGLSGPNAVLADALPTVPLTLPDGSEVLRATPEATGVLDPFTGASSPASTTPPTGDLPTSVGIGIAGC